MASRREQDCGSKWIAPTVRHALYLRDGFCCVYCGAGIEDGARLTIDHVLAVELGGTDVTSNLATACLSCNSAKRALPIRGWYAYLRSAGIDTDRVGPRVRRQLGRELDLAAGRALARAAREARRAARAA